MNIGEANERYRYALKRGMEGWDVIAIQIGLNSTVPSPNLAEDGIFGPRTDTAVRTVQASLSLAVDGVIGPLTQAALCSKLCGQVEAGQVPRGLVKGICMGESGGVIPTTSSRYLNETRDYGPLQANLPVHSAESAFRRAFSPTLAAHGVVEVLQHARQLYAGVKGLSEEELWRLAVLHYNWPAAADAIAGGKSTTWVYTEEGTHAMRRLSDPAPWVEAFRIPGVRTGWDWCKFYIDSKVVYVTDWRVH